MQNVNSLIKTILLKDSDKREIIIDLSAFCIINTNKQYVETQYNFILAVMLVHTHTVAVFLC